MSKEYHDFLGNIPYGWKVKKLKELVEFKNGKAHEQCVDENGEYILVTSKFVSTEGDEYRRTNQALSMLNKNDIAFVMSDVPNGKALAKCFLVDVDNKYTLNQRICSLTTSSMNHQFLFYFLNRNKYYLKFDNGVGQTNLRKDEVLDCPVFVPPLKEQQKIAEILSSVDAAIEKTEQVIAKTERLKKGLMQQLLIKGISHTEYKDSELGEIPLKWEIKQLKDLLEIKYGKDQKQVICEDGKYNILGTGGIIGKTNSYLYDKPSVLIGRKGTINRPMYIEEPFWTVDTLFYTVINTNNFEKWIYYAISNINLMKYNEATGVPSLSVNNLNTIKFAVPPYDEQVKIVNILDSTEQKIQSENLKLNRLMILKQGLMQKLLTGQVRVKID